MKHRMRFQKPKESSLHRHKGKTLRRTKKNNLFAAGFKPKKRKCTHPSSASPSFLRPPSSAMLGDGCSACSLRKLVALTLLTLLAVVLGTRFTTDLSKRKARVFYAVGIVFPWFLMLFCFIFCCFVLFFNTM